MQNANIFGNFSAGRISCSTDGGHVSWTQLRSELEEALSLTGFGGMEWEFGI